MSMYQIGIRTMDKRRGVLLVEENGHCYVYHSGMVSLIKWYLSRIYRSKGINESCRLETGNQNKKATPKLWLVTKEKKMH